MRLLTEDAIHFHDRSAKIAFLKNLWLNTSPTAEAISSQRLLTAGHVGLDRQSLTI